jgi:hypothetical protein
VTSRAEAEPVNVSAPLPFCSSDSVQCVHNADRGDGKRSILPKGERTHSGWLGPAVRVLPLNKIFQNCQKVLACARGAGRS